QAAGVALQKANLAYEQAQARYRSVQAAKSAYQIEITLLERKVMYWKTRLDRATERLKDAQLIAPLDGIVISLDAKVGNNVDPYTLVGVLADPTELEVDATVPEADVGPVALGQVVHVTLDAYPDKVYPAQVKAVSSQAVIWQGKQAYHVTVVFDEPGGVPATIRMGADVRIIVRTKDNVLIVPTQAIYTVAGESYVEVVGTDGRRQRMAVVTGLANETETEVVSGLQEGDVVVIP
ncbi:MAG: efflux RND transporter periplasmic adaptor subunit, partial [Chloroflexi bacterium]|nr:efflux RND transporter periplasmic adaptor subunit [Chloroflexota bacterium]